MATLFKLGYSLAVATLFIVVVIFGVNTFYDGPDRDDYSNYPQYDDARADYERNVFIFAAAFGAAAIAGGVALYRKVEAMPLGLVFGGLGVVLFGLAQAGDSFEDIGAAPIFATSIIGLLIVLAAGYRFLGFTPGGD